MNEHGQREKFQSIGPNVEWVRDSLLSQIIEVEKACS